VTLDEMRKLIDEATPAHKPLNHSGVALDVSDADARFIADARTLLPALLDVAEKARDLYEASFDCLRQSENEDDAISQMGRLNDTCAATGEALEAIEALKVT
jgi:hypothetical protein